MINDGDAPLVYLCLSTQHKCEVVGYPDSNKVAMSAGPSVVDARGAAREQKKEPWVRQKHRKGESHAYYYN
jgi:uncharacterized cupin superfamily protein